MRSVLASIVLAALGLGNPIASASPPVSVSSAASPAPTQSAPGSCSPNSKVTIEYAGNEKIMSRWLQITSTTECTTDGGCKTATDPITFEYKAFGYEDGDDVYWTAPKLVKTKGPRTVTVKPSPCEVPKGEKVCVWASVDYGMYTLSVDQEYRKEVNGKCEDNRLDVKISASGPISDAEVRTVCIVGGCRAKDADYWDTASMRNA